MGYKQITLIAGHDTNEEREELTLDWLRKHNVTIEDERGLLILTMRAELVRGQHRDEYVQPGARPLRHPRLCRV